MVKLHTRFGVITLELFEEKAPETVANFLAYAEAGHYDGTIFHRVINNFMVQGGGHLPDLSQKPTTSSVKNEANNGLKNELGTVAMARTQDPHSATAQFFINVANNEFLNFTKESTQGWGYCVFGKVVEGMDVVDQIRNVKTGRRSFYQDVPVDDILIDRVEIV